MLVVQVSRACGLWGAAQPCKWVLLVSAVRGTNMAFSYWLDQAQVSGTWAQSTDMHEPLVR